MQRHKSACKAKNINLKDYTLDDRRWLIDWLVVEENVDKIQTPILFPR